MSIVSALAPRRAELFAVSVPLAVTSTGCFHGRTPSSMEELARELGKKVRKAVPAITACYERSLKRNPLLSGKVVVFGTVTPAGTVQGVGIEHDTLGDPEVASCLTGLISRVRIPAHSNGEVDFSYPFIFQSSD
jgi:hypothetical protein